MAWRKSKASGCTKMTLKKYADRPGPPYHAADCAEQTKKGNDGADYVSKEGSNGVYRWVKAGATRKAKGVKRYEIHDNGSKPFVVDDDSKKIVVSGKYLILRQIRIVWERRSLNRPTRSYLSARIR